MIITLTHLHHLQLLKSSLNELLDLSRILYVGILSKRVSCSSLCVLFEVVRRELVALP